jgi:hypothetical protein
MNQEAIDEIRTMFEADAHSRPSPIEFEMAYQVRVAIDRIRFAIKSTEATEDHRGSLQLRESEMQLLDALDRLEGLDRRFQTRSKNR